MALTTTRAGDEAAARSQRSHLAAPSERLTALQEEQNRVCHAIGVAKRRGEDADELIQENKRISQQISALVEQVRDAEGHEHNRGTGDESLVASVESSPAAFRELRDEWNNLLLASDCDSPFLTWEWLYTWWEVYGGDKELYLVLVRSGDGKLVGAAPLMLGYRDFRHPKRLHRRTLAFVGTGECLGPNYLGFAAAPGREAEVVRAVLGRMTRDAELWDVALLRHVPCEGSSTRILADLAAHEQLCVLVGPGQPCVWGTLPETFEEYVQTVPSQSRRSYLRNEEKHLREHFGDVRFLTCQTPQEAEEHVQTLVDLHLSRFAAKGERSAWADPQTHRLALRLAPRLFRKGWFCTDVLVVEGDPAACLMGFQFRGRYFVLQTGFAPRFTQFHPTHVLYARRIRTLIEQGVKVFDFLGGAYDYKKQYFAQRRYVTTLTVFPDACSHRFRASWRLAAECAIPAAREAVTRLLKGRSRAGPMSEEPQT